MNNAFTKNRKKGFILQQVIDMLKDNGFIFSSNSRLMFKYFLFPCQMSKGNTTVSLEKVVEDIYKKLYE